ncbi:hypothetical protein GCM10025738_18560 [Microbacterium fluvii]
MPVVFAANPWPVTVTAPPSRDTTGALTEGPAAIAGVAVIAPAITRRKLISVAIAAFRRVGAGAGVLVLLAFTYLSVGSRSCASARFRCVSAFG